jgi:hypothetical protein
MCNISSGATSGEETACPSGAPEFITGFWWDLCCQSIYFQVVMSTAIYA